MAKFVINKLIRDKIPEIEGKWELNVLNDQEFKNSLYLKLEEEVEELKAATGRNDLIEEMADILEVLSSIAHLNGFSIEDVMVAKNHKSNLKGGFNKRLYALTAEYNESSYKTIEKLRNAKKYKEIL